MAVFVSSLGGGLSFLQKNAKYVGFSQRGKGGRKIELFTIFFLLQINGKKGYDCRGNSRKQIFI